MTVRGYVSGAVRDPGRALHPQQPRALQPARLGDDLDRRGIRGRSSSVVRDPVRRGSDHRHRVAAHAAGRAVRLALPLPRDGLAAAPRHHAAGPRIRSRVSRDGRSGRRGPRGHPLPTRLDDRRILRRGGGRNWTLPHFGIAFAATGLVLLTKRDLRRPAAIGLTASFLACIAWYAPHLDDLMSSSRQDYGARIDGAWVVRHRSIRYSCPVLGWIDEVLVDPGVGSLVLVAALTLLIGSSPFSARVSRRSSSAPDAWRPS